MRNVGLACLGALVALAVVAEANHVAGCVPGWADPATMNEFDVGARHFYVEERDVPPPFDTSPPIPGSGFLLGSGVWFYEETNDLGGLQRGTVCGVAGCGNCFPEEPFPCLILDQDPWWDENCRHGPDKLWF